MAEFTRRVFLRTGILGTAGLALGSQLDKLLYASEKDGNLYSFQKAFGPSPLSLLFAISVKPDAVCWGWSWMENLLVSWAIPKYPINKGGLCARAIAGVILLTIRKEFFFL